MPDGQPSNGPVAGPATDTTTPVYLHATSTAVPPHVLHQDDVLSRSKALFNGRGEAFERLLPIYQNAGIDTRYSCVPIEWYLRSSGWHDRNALFIDSAVDLLQSAAADCLDDADLAAADVDVLIVASTTGIATPSLDARLMQIMDFRPDVVRLPIFGLGCAGGVLGLARAAAMARAMPGARVLFLVVELCGLTFRPGDTSNANIVATALFGDGAAAAVLSSPGTGRQIPAAVANIGPAGETTWPDTLDIMGWTVEDDGLGVLFSRDIPTIVRDRFGAAVDTFLTEQQLSRTDLAGTLCHPGGAKVIAALERVFDVPQGTMAHARGVLRDYGNMSAATVLFVLARALNAGDRGRHLLTALGPGFTAGFLLMDLLDQ